MRKHFELIGELCEVKAVVGDKAIFYFEDGHGYAEINGATFTCRTLEEFYEMVEDFGEDGFAE